MIHNMTNNQILDELNKIVYGSLDAKKKLINLINRSKTRYFQKHVYQEAEKDFVKPAKLLISGESGTGKTYLINTLQKIIHFPLVCIDANSLLPTGAGKDSGMKVADVEKLIKKTAMNTLATHRYLYHSYEGVMSQMVVFVDEFDKLGDGWGDYGWRCGTQSAFLTLVENSAEFADVSWVFAGAFSKHRNVSPSRPIGFSKNDEVSETAKIDDEMVIKSGIITEFVGRLTDIVELDRPTFDFYEKIIRGLLIPEKQREMLSLNRDMIDVSEDFIKRSINSALKKQQGVRGLKRDLYNLFSDAEFDDTNVKIYQKVDEIVEDVKNNDSDFLKDEIDRMVYGG